MAIPLILASKSLPRRNVLNAAGVCPTIRVSHVDEPAALRDAAAKAGVTGERVDAAARKVISDAGYGAYFGHSFGHSLGLDIHEHPIAAPGVHAKLPEHTVISAEPGIYLPGKFGVRIEDVMHLTADGAEILTRSPKNLIIL